MKDKLLKGIIIGTQLGTITLFGSLFYKMKKENQKFKFSMEDLNNVEDSIIQSNNNFKIDFDYIKNNNICRIVKNFYEVLSKDEAVDLTNFKKNIKTLKIKSIKACEGELGDSVDVLYDYYNNIIYYGLLAKTRILAHELFHMSSTVYNDDNKDVKYMGFGQSKHNFEIGMD